MTRVKICGLMNEEDVNLCVQAGVHMVGLVVEYPLPVPWNLTHEEARNLIQCVPPLVDTCIVTGGTVEKVIDIANKTNPNIVQLHYKETLADVEEIASQLRSKGIQTTKALRIDSNGNCDFEIRDPVQAAKALSTSGISAIIVDSYTESMPGGTGVMVNLSAFQTIQRESSLPVILAGGLNPMNIQALIDDVQPYAVDVLTGVEVIPGKKDAEKITEFLRCCQAVD
ncbi:phosphoribosylanthranilate isomerase [Bacillus sp. Marseille-P3661]|uniref:phosphoribosylanthranilate isomerase n=1 Tax=Bacillus sp. Marseille-P3661 TaxID=1936234 RepID=UPI000C862B4D|nr:phosphoribosylanthranilate isomerase [Bacillus sp. Marseille-P3661]